MDEAAQVRFVLASEGDGTASVDCIVISSVSGGHLPPPGHPVTLPLLLPEPSWMGDSLLQLLHEWASRDAVVDMRLTQGRNGLVAKLACSDSRMSLAIAET